MRGPICFDRPTHQEQAQNDTQDILFLFGQVLHVLQYRGSWPIHNGELVWSSMILVPEILLLI